MTALRSVSSASELLQVGVSIEGITYYQLQAELYELSDEGQTALQASTEITPSYALKLRHEGNELDVRLATTLEVGIGKVVVDAIVNYVTAEPVVMSEEVRLEFANEVGIMALLPFVRQAIADLSQRVFGQVVLMPVLKRGDLSFSPADGRSELGVVPPHPEAPPGTEDGSADRETL